MFSILIVFSFAFTIWNTSSRFCVYGRILLFAKCFMYFLYSNFISNWIHLFLPYWVADLDSIKTSFDFFRLKILFIFLDSISLHSFSFHLPSFHDLFISFLIISLLFIKFLFISLTFSSLHFISFHFISFHFLLEHQWTSSISLFLSLCLSLSFIDCSGISKSYRQLHLNFMFGRSLVYLQFKWHKSQLPKFNNQFKKQQRKLTSFSFFFVIYWLVNCFNFFFNKLCYITMPDANTET